VGGRTPPFQRTEGDRGLFNPLTSIIEPVSNESASALPGRWKKLKSWGKLSVSIPALVVFATLALPQKSLSPPRGSVQPQLQGCWDRGVTPIPGELVWCLEDAGATREPPPGLPGVLVWGPVSHAAAQCWGSSWGVGGTLCSPSSTVQWVLLQGTVRCEVLALSLPSEVQRVPPPCCGLSASLGTGTAVPAQPRGCH